MLSFSWLVDFDVKYKHLLFEPCPAMSPNISEQPLWILSSPILKLSHAKVRNNSELQICWFYPASQLAVLSFNHQWISMVTWMSLGWWEGSFHLLCLSIRTFIVDNLQGLLDIAPGFSCQSAESFHQFESWCQMTIHEPAKVILLSVLFPHISLVLIPP